MHRQRKQRLTLLIFLLTGLSATLGMTLYALSQHVDLYVTPTQVIAAHLQQRQSFRLGGLVEKGSVHYHAHNLIVDFVLTDLHHRVNVQYDGVLPTLFREGQGIVAQGRMNSTGIFIADQVLAKHSADYHPPGIP